MRLDIKDNCEIHETRARDTKVKEIQAKATDGQAHLLKLNVLTAPLIRNEPLPIDLLLIGSTYFDYSFHG